MWCTVQGTWAVAPICVVTTVEFSVPKYMGVPKRLSMPPSMPLLASRWFSTGSGRCTGMGYGPAVSLAWIRECECVWSTASCRCVGVGWLWPSITLVESKLVMLLPPADAALWAYGCGTGTGSPSFDCDIIKFWFICLTDGSLAGVVMVAATVFPPPGDADAVWSAEGKTEEVRWGDILKCVNICAVRRRRNSLSDKQ